MAKQPSKPRKTTGPLNRKIDANKISIANLDKNLSKTSAGKHEKFFNMYETTELQKMRGRAFEKGNLNVLKKVNSVLNKRMGFTGSELRAKNKNDMTFYMGDLLEVQLRLKAEAKAKRQQKTLTRKLNKVVKEHDIVLTNELMINGIIPNPKIIEAGREAFIKKQVFLNDKRTDKFKVKDEARMLEIANRKFDVLERKAKKLKANKIKEYAIDEVKNHMIGKGGYFINGDPDLQATINEYLKHLPLEKILEIPNLLYSDEFNRIWDSDEEQQNGIMLDESKNERARARQEELIRILENETGKIIEVNGNKVNIKETKQLSSKHLTITNYTFK